MTPRTLGLCVVLGVATAAHLSFSWMWLETADAGQVLAYSRLILDGRMPHRDFMTIRMAGSPLLYLPLARWGGDWTLWLARWCVWLQFAWLGWAWTGIFSRLMAWRPSPWERVCWALAIFIGSIHTAALYPGEAMDSLWLLSVGLRLALSDRPRWKGLGYLLLGSSAICKQSFGLMAPAALLILGDGRRWWCWLAAAAPILTYGGVMALTGSLPDAWLQGGAYHDLATPGMAHYLTSRACWLGVGLGAGLGWLMAAADRRVRVPSAWPPRLGLSAAGIVWGLWLAAAVFLAHSWSARWTYEVYAFGVFGVVLGMSAGWVGRPAVVVRTGQMQAGVLALMTAWSASLSLYYPTPAFGMGPMLGFLWACARRIWDASQAGRIRRRGLWKGMTAVLTGLLVLGFVYGRYTNVRCWEHALSARQLTRPAGGVLRGARGLWTDPRTARWLEDLNRVVARVGARPYAIVPGTIPAYWIRASGPNPLPAVCVHPDELMHPALVQRMLCALEEQRGRIVILVEKFGFCEARAGCPPADERDPFIRRIRERYARIGDTEFFTLYQ